MSHPAPSRARATRRRPVVHRLRSSIVGALIVAAAALLAIGCGGSGGKAVADADSDQGPLAWLPADTVAVATLRLDAKQLDTALDTLARLPVWSLAEAYLPASDGAGLRTWVLEQVGEHGGADDADNDVSAKQLEAAFGTQAGGALLAIDEKITTDEASLAIWVEVKDAEAATKAVKRLTGGSDTRHTHEGQEYFYAKDEHLAWLIRDELLVGASTRTQLEQLIDLREGDDEQTLAGDDTGRAVLEAVADGAMVSGAVATDPLLAAIPEMVELADAELDATDAKLVKDLTALAGEPAVDSLIADWIGLGATVDDSGLRVRAAWSNPRDLADPKVSSRELMERMPADAVMASTAVGDGSMLQRAQQAWAAASDKLDLDIRELMDEACGSATKEWACTLGTELLVTALEDEALAEAYDAMDDNVFGMSMSGDALLAAVDPTTTGEQFTKPLYEVALSNSLDVTGDWVPSKELADALDAAGLHMEADDTSVTVRITPGSPLARELRNLSDVDRATFDAVGIDVATLTSAKGLTLTGEQVDDLLVIGIPTLKGGTLAKALRGDVDVLGDDETYREVRDAARVPDEVGAYSYTNLLNIVETVFAAEEDSAFQRAVPAIRNNLTDIPVILQWSAREEYNGQQVGVYDNVIPILE